MFDNLLGSDLVRALAIAAGVLGVGRRVGCGIRLVVGLGGAGGASLGGDEVLILAEDLVHGVDEGVDGLGRLKYGVGVDTLDDEVEGLVGRLAGLGGIGLHTGGVLVSAGDVESLVGIVQGFQLGHVGVEVEGLEGFRYVSLGEVEQQAIDQGGLLGVGLGVDLVVGPQHAVYQQGGGTQGLVGAYLIGAVHGVDELEGLVTLLVFRLQLGGGGALGDAVHALRLPVDAFLVTRGEGLQMEGGHGRIQDTGVDIVVHVHVAGVGQRGLRYRSDLFR